jgi:hypothetical protein
VHIWWHKSLFHIELGQYDAALQIYALSLAHERLAARPDSHPNLRFLQQAEAITV